MGDMDSVGRLLNVVLGPGSRAHNQVSRPTASDGAVGGSDDLAPGFRPQPDWNLKDFGGPTAAELTFVNRYVGGSAEWAADDMTNIDQAMSSAMSDPGLQSVIAQYYNGPISSTILPSAVHEGSVPATVYKDVAEKLVVQLHGEGALGTADPAKSIINIMLPRGVVLSDDFSPGFQPPAGQEAEHERRKGGVLKLDPDDAADSKNGLGGYHGSVHLGDGSEIYYAVGVYSEGDNGIVAFDQSWKNVVATFYHELNEARTDAAVEDVNATNDEKLLGWYSQTGQGEIGDLPINALNGFGLDLSAVFTEVPLADGSGTVPIQLMWSNAAGGPAASASANAALQTPA
ncbi:MAG: hypothetical protein ACXVFQ_23565 [Solirubrobacteraceae bacterium]